MIINLLINKSTYNSADRIINEPEQNEYVITNIDTTKNFIDYSDNLTAIFRGEIVTNDVFFTAIEVIAENDLEKKKLNYNMDKTYYFVTDDSEKVFNNATIKSLKLDVIRTFFKPIISFAMASKVVKVNRQHLDRFRPDGSVDPTNEIFNLREFNYGDLENDYYRIQNIPLQDNPDETSLWGINYSQYMDNRSNILLGSFDLTKIKNAEIKNYVSPLIGEIKYLPMNFFIAPVLNNNDDDNYPNHINKLNDDKTISINVLPFDPIQRDSIGGFEIKKVENNSFGHTIYNIGSNTLKQKEYNFINSNTFPLNNFGNISAIKSATYDDLYKNEIALLNNIYTFNLFINFNIDQKITIGARDILSKLLFSIYPNISDIQYEVVMATGQRFSTSDSPTINLNNDAYKNYIQENKNSITSSRRSANMGIGTSILSTGLGIAGIVGSFFTAGASLPLAIGAGALAAKGINDAANSSVERANIDKNMQDYKNINKSTAGNLNIYASLDDDLVGFNMIVNQSNDFLIKQVTNYFNKVGYKIGGYRKLRGNNEWWRSRVKWNYWEIEELNSCYDNFSKNGLNASIITEIENLFKIGIRFFNSNDDIDFSLNNYEISLN